MAGKENSKPNERPESGGWLGARVPMGLALLLYLGTASYWAMPGAPAGWLVSASGIGPFPALSFPLWSALVRLLDWLPLGPLAVCVGVLNALLAAASVGLLYRLLSEGRTERTTAAAAALYLGLSFPLWMVASRSYPQGLGLLLLLAALRQLQLFRLTGLRQRFYRFACLYGLGMAEYPTVVLLALPIALYGLILLHAKKQLSVRVVMLSVVCAASGLLLFLAHALFFTSSPAFTWMGFEHVGQVVWEMWRREWLALRYTMGRGGWLLVALVTLVPWLLTEWLARTHYKKQARWASRAIHAAVLVLLLGILFNGPMAPWSFMGPRPLLLLPVLLAAVAFGRSVDYTFSARWRRSARASRPWPGWVCKTLLAAVAIGALTVNYPRIETRSGRAVAIWTNAVLDAMDGRPWLASDGLLADSLRLAAHDRDLDVRLLVGRRLSAPGHEANLRSTLPTNTLRALVPAGLDAVLREWLTNDPEAPRQVVLLSGMDPWLAAGLRPAPDRVVYRGLSADDQVDLEAHREQQLDFWQRWQPAAERWSGARTPESGYARALLHQTAAVANNLGVFYEYSSNLVYAAEAYRAALRMDPENISAMLNRGGLTNTSPSETRAAVDAWVEQHPRPVPLSVLARRFGHVRQAASLKPLYAAWGMDRAVTNAPSSAPLRAAVDHCRRGEWTEAKAQVEHVLGEGEASAAAWVVFATIADAQGDTGALARAAGEMEERGARWPAVLYFQGRQAAGEGRYHEAALLLREASARMPTDIRSLEALLAVELHLREGDRPMAVAKALLRLDPGSALANFVLGSDYYAAGESELAQVSLQKSIDRLPTPAALNNLAWLLHEQGLHSNAVTLAEAAVKAVPGNYAFWDTLGVIQLAMEDPELALHALAPAHELVPGRPSVRVHLAQCLVVLGRDEEARQALDGVAARLDDLPPEAVEAYKVLVEQLARP